tara:strand:+ start:335 stop:475 length:141 start_codon:yes stop_codon:yes gene_type:complete
MNKYSVILMGVDWSKAAKLKAMKDIKLEDPRIAKYIESLDKMYKLI